MFLSMKKIIAILLCVAMTLTNAGVSTFATSIESVAMVAKQVDSNRRTIDYRFYEAFKYEKRTSYLMKDDESDSLKESTQQSEPLSGIGGSTKISDDVSPSFDVGNNDANDDKSRATLSDADDDSENDDENTTGNNIEEPEDDGTIKKVSDDDTDTATISDADDSSGSAATDEPEDDDIDTATVSDADDSSGSTATDETEDDDIDTATTSDTDTTVNSSTNDEDENDDTTATTSDAADKEASNKNDENDDNTASNSNAKKLPLNLQPMIASDSESTLFGVTDYTLPNTWYNGTSAGTAKQYVQSITISKYPTPAPATYTHNYTIPGSDGLEVYANVTGTGTSQRSDVTIYAPENKTIYAAEDSSDMFGMFFIITDLNFLSNLDTSNVTNMQSMFSGCESLMGLDLSNFNTNNVTNMQGMFNSCRELTWIDLSSFNTASVSDMSSMFMYCNNLTSLDLSNFNTSNVTNMQYMFGNCNSLTSLNVSNFDTSNVTDMTNMFNSCSSLTSLNTSRFNTSNVTNMYGMFDYCQSLTSLDLSNFNTSNVTEMRNMFFSCYALTTIIASTSFVTTAVTAGNDADMFSGCNHLEGGNGTKWSDRNAADSTTAKDKTYAKIDRVGDPGYFTFTGPYYTLPNTWYNETRAGTAKQYVQSITISKYPTPTPTTYTHNYTIPGSDGLRVYANVTGTGTSQRSDVTIYAPENKTICAAEDSSGLFREFIIITSLDLSNLDTSNVTDMSDMFRGCQALTSLNVSNFDTSNITDMRYMFSECQALTSLDVSSFNTSKVTDMRDMFSDCHALTTIIASTSFVTTAVTAGNDADMFSGCNHLEGGNGIKWSDKNGADPTTANNKTYAWIDGRHAQGGYFRGTGDGSGSGTDGDGTKVYSIRIKASPSKIDYEVSEHFDPAGLVLEVQWTDGYKSEVTYDNTTKRDFTFNPATTSELQLTDTNVVITYKGAHTTFNIGVRDWYPDENVSSIKITRKPQTQYTVDDTLNLDNLEIKVTYTDARSTRNVTYKNNETMFIVTPSTTKKLQITDKTVTVTFGGKEDKFDIVVDEVPVNEDISDMRIIKPPILVNYIEGQKLDPSGLVIEVTYSAGTKKQITYDEYANKFSLSKDNALTLTDENVTVTFGGKTDTFALTVIEAVNLDKDVSSIKIKKILGKVNYIVGEKLNLSGLVLEVTYSNNLLTKLLGNNIKAGKTFLIDYNTYSNLFSSVPGITQSLNTNNKIVTLTFGGKQLTFNINVNKVSNSYGPSNGGSSSSGGGGGGGLSGGLPVTEMNTVIETVILSSDYEWIYNEEGQRDGVKLKKESALAKALMSSDNYKENYKDIGEEGYIQIQNGFYNLQCGGVSFFFGFSQTGKMLTGFVKTKDDTEHYWVDETTYTLTAIGKPGSAKYYLYNENGDYRGIIWSLPITIGNTLYTFDQSGRVLTETYVPNNNVVALSTTGWDYNPIDDSWKYYNTDSMGNRYYIRDEVKEITDNGVSHYYIFGEDEKMKTGLTEYKGKTYYLVENGDYKGAVYTGLLLLDGKTLIFDEQGVLVSDNNEVKALTTTQ